MCRENCNCNRCCQQDKCKTCRYEGPDIEGIGITSGMSFDDVTTILSEYVSNLQFTEGVPGPQGNIGETGDQGIQGIQGLQGIPGDVQVFGLTAQWNYNNDITQPPVSGEVKFDLAFGTGITHTYISKLDVDLNDKSEFVFSFVREDVGDLSYIRGGIIRVFDVSNINRYVEFEVISGVDMTTYYDITIKYLKAPSGWFINDSTVGVTYTPSESIVRTKIIDIGPWNMDAVGAVSVTHDLADYSIIRNVEVTIVPDDSSYILPLNSFSGTANEVQGGVAQISDIDITISRKNTGRFDDTDFSDSVMNRGYLKIDYLK